MAIELMDNRHQGRSLCLDILCTTKLFNIFLFFYVLSGASLSCNVWFRLAQSVLVKDVGLPWMSVCIKIKVM